MNEVANNDGKIVGTGVYLTPEWKRELLERQAEVRSTPLIRVHGRWLPDEVLEAFKCRIDSMAVEAGLPAPERDADGDINHYGIDPDSDEFVRWEPPTRLIGGQE